MSSPRLESVRGLSPEGLIYLQKGEVQMISVITGSLVVILVVTIVRWMAAIPLLQALSASIDDWADELHGQDGVGRL